MAENGTRLASLRARLAKLELIRRPLSPEETAELRVVFPVLVLAHHGRVWGRLQRRLQDDDQAMDLTQEGFQSLYFDLVDHGFPENLERRLNTFALHHLLHHLRDRNLERERFTTGVPSSGSERPRSSRQPDLDRAIDLATVLTLPERLPLIYREVVELMVLGDLSASEAQEILDIPEGTVRSRLREAKAQLREMIKGSAESTR